MDYLHGTAARILMAVGVGILAGSGRASVVWDESVNGGLSGNQAAPTAIALNAGTNSVIGTVGGTATQDWVAVTVPTGFDLSSYTLAAYQSADAQGFTGFQIGSSFVGSTTSAASYAGYAHYGTGATNPGPPPMSVLGVNLLPLMANPAIAVGSAGFTDPLSSGTYTFLIQQLGGTTNYQFDFGVTAAPEPGSLGVLGFCGVGLLMRRRRA